jgi:GNAT superfamily N-acetyltransferase
LNPQHLAGQRLGPDSVSAIHQLCAESLGRHCPARDDLRQGLFSSPPGQPLPIVRGDPTYGVVASVRRGEAGFIRLLAVRPEHQRRGLATALLGAAQEDLSNCEHVTVGADAPDYLFPGVASDLTPMLCFLESRRYPRVDSHFNMNLDLTELPADPGGTALADPARRDEVEQWCLQHWPWWREEAVRALEKNRLLVTGAPGELGGFCAWDVTRQGWLGPVAVAPTHIGTGRGIPLLLGALHRMRDEGRSAVEIAWVGPIRVYARLGATVGDVFFVHRRTRKVARRA